MRLIPRSYRLLLCLLPAGALLLAGCGQSSSQGTTAARVEKTNKPAHDHSGWWCNEHGVPEEECSMCSAKVAAEKKKEGDWCEKHDRALSQCFICNPKAQEKYAALYRAKNNGKDPPEATDNQPPKDGDKK